MANDGVNLRVMPGTIHAIVGENGAGKSTLMKILYGAQPPDEGRILVNGLEQSFRSPRDAIAVGIGMVFQHFMLADNLTVWENIVLGDEPGSGFRMDVGAARKRIRELGRNYGLDVDPDELVAELGVGDKQRAEIIKVLYRNARIIILDEPTTVLVPQEVDELFDSLRGLVARGVTIIFISHKLDEVLRVADAITVIRAGRTVAEVLPSEVTARDLAELMVGSELPKPDTRESTVTDRVALRVTGLTVTGRRRPDHARRRVVQHPRGRDPRRGRRGGERPDRAARGHHGHPAPRARRDRDGGPWTWPAWARGCGASEASATSRRTASTTGWC